MGFKHIRVTDETYNQVKERAGDGTMAEYVRELIKQKPRLDVLGVAVEAISTELDNLHKILIENIEREHERAKLQMDVNETVYALRTPLSNMEKTLKILAKREVERSEVVNNEQ